MEFFIGPKLRKLPKLIKMRLKTKKKYSKTGIFLYITKNINLFISEKPTSPKLVAIVTSNLVNHGTYHTKLFPKTFFQNTRSLTTHLRKFFNKVKLWKSAQAEFPWLSNRSIRWRVNPIKIDTVRVLVCMCLGTNYAIVTVL